MALTALDLAPPGLVHELLGCLGDDRVSVIVKPVYQRPYRGVFLIFDDGCVVKCADQITAGLEFTKQSLVVDVEP